MKALYASLGYKIGGYAGVTMPVVDPPAQIAPDTILSGHHGWIFTLRDPMRVGVALCLPDGSEKIMYMNLQGLKQAILDIGYCGAMVEGMTYANNPNMRFSKKTRIGVPECVTPAR